jgi:MFS family permease
LTIGGGLFALLLALSQGQEWGWMGYRVLMLIVGGLLLLALFVVIELHVPRPLIDVRVFRIWPFTNSLLLVSVSSVGLFAMLFYVPLFLQDGQGVTAFRAGLMMLPEAVAMGALMPVAGQLYDRFGPRWPATIGLVIAAWGTYLLCGINADMTAQEVVLWTWVRGIGNALAMMAIMTAGLDAVPPGLINQASALSNAVQRVSASLGLAVLTAIATQQQAQLSADRSALLGTPAAAGRAELNDLMRYGFGGMYALYRRTQLSILASAYSDVFLVITVVTLIGAMLAMLLKIPAKSAPDSAASMGGSSPGTEAVALAGGHVDTEELAQSAAVSRFVH